MLRLRALVIVTAALLGLVPVLVVSGSAHAAAPADVFIGDVNDSSDPVDPYATVFYFVPVGNQGPGTATAVTVTSLLPPGVSFQPSGSSGGCAAAPTIVTCALSSLLAGSGAVLIIGFTPTVSGVLSLTFTASAAELDRELSNNTQTETTTVTSDADVALDLGSGAGVVYTGERFFLATHVSNLGPAPATGVTATLRLPAGLSVAFGASCIPDGAASVCTIGPIDLPPSTGSVALVEMSGSSAGVYTVSGSVGANEPDPQPANNTDSVTVTLTPAADVAVTVAESADPTAPGKALTYTMTVINYGPSPASAVSLTAGWVATGSGGIQFLSAATSLGNCASTAPSRMSCDLGGLASGATATITLLLRPRGLGSVSIHVEVMAAEHDRDASNNVATEATVVG